MISSKCGLLSLASLVCLLFLAASCEPPGKPSSQEQELAEPQTFEVLFANNCSGCHGRNGQQGPARVLNDAVYLAVTPKEAIHTILISGRKNTLMPAWSQANGGPLTDKQIDTLVDGMYANWAKPSASSSSLPDYYGAGLTGDPAQGKKLFGRNCFMCHAKGGIAGALTPAYLALSSNQNLRTSIIVGRLDLQGIKMPNYLSLNAGHALSNQDIADLVSYLSSMRPADSNIAKAEEQTFKSSETDKSDVKGGNQ